MWLSDPLLSLSHCGFGELVQNKKVVRDRAYPENCARLLDLASANDAMMAIKEWPDYRPTPLIFLDGLARKCTVRQIAYKDEASRFGLGSFKALGGAYAVYRVLSKKLQEAGFNPADITVDTLLSGQYQSITQNIVVTCATDGNHGRSVAWGGHIFGCRCTVFLHEGVSIGRQRAIEQYGAEIIRTSGNYDDSVRAASRMAEERGWVVVSDTSYQGYTEIPRYVMSGYMVMMEEICDQLKEPPTHIVVQGGVGGLAAAAVAYFWERLGRKRPKIIVVEPVKADCLLRSAKAGRLVTVEGDLDTLMAGLACGEPSMLAWHILEQGVDEFISLPDSVVPITMRLLALSPYGDPSVVAGESAVAGLGLLVIACANPDYRQLLGFEDNSSILLFGTEGATDPEIYEKVLTRAAL